MIKKEEKNKINKQKQNKKDREAGLVVKGSICSQANTVPCFIKIIIDSTHGARFHTSASTSF